MPRQRQTSPCPGRAARPPAKAMNMKEPMMGEMKKDGMMKEDVKQGGAEVGRENERGYEAGKNEVVTLHPRRLTP